MCEAGVGLSARARRIHAPLQRTVHCKCLFATLEIENKREGASRSTAHWASAGADERISTFETKLSTRRKCEMCLFACLYLSCGHAAQYLSRSGGAAGVGLVLREGWLQGPPQGFLQTLGKSQSGQSCLHRAGARTPTLCLPVFPDRNPESLVGEDI